jgi:hypothetical protein
MVNFYVLFSPVYFIYSTVDSRLFRPLSRIVQKVIRGCLMFVFRREALPKDPVFPADLKQLGYGFYQILVTSVQRLD